jgi:hypothetical protein
MASAGSMVPHPQDASARPPAETCDSVRLCALSTQTVPQVMGHDNFIIELLGNWVLCGQASLFGTHENGLAIAADGTWYKLYDMGGTLYRGNGFDEQGTWQVIDEIFGPGPGWYQVNFTIAGGGTATTKPVFADNPRKMHVDNNGVFRADYVRSECASGSPGSMDAGAVEATVAAPPDASPPPPAVDSSTCDYPSLCSVPEQPVATATTQATLAMQLVGDWVQCGQTSFFGTQESGLAIVVDGTWYKLYDMGGTFYRGQGPSQHGTWNLVDTSVENGPGVFQVNFSPTDGSGTADTFPAFAVNPRKMRLDNNGVFRADYVSAPCSP